MKGAEERVREGGGGAGVGVDGGGEVGPPERSEEALRIRQAALDSSVSAVAMSDLEGRLTYVNPAFLRLWGYGEAGEVLGRSALEFWTDPEAAAQVMAVLAAEGSWAGELEARRRDGQVLDVLLSANLVRDGLGRPLCLMASFVDITQRKRAERQVREARDRLEAMLQAIPDLLFELDDAGVFVDYRAPSLEMLAFPPASFLGRNVREVLPAGALASLLPALEETRQTGRSLGTQYWLPMPGGERWYEASMARRVPLPGEKPRLVVLARDITGRRRAEEEIRRQNRELAVLNEIGQGLHRLTDPGAMANLVFSKLKGLLDDRNLYIALVDQGRGEVFFPVYTVDGERRPPFSRPAGLGLTEYIVKRRAPLCLNENCTEEAERLGLQLLGRPCRSYLGVPMASGEQVEGVIALQDYEREGVYTANDVRLLSTVAAMAGGALANARLLAQARRELAERERVEEALRQSRLDLERAQAVGHIGSWVSIQEPEPRMYWSAETCRIFGMAPEAFDGRPESFFRMVHPGDLEAVRAARERALRGEASYDVQHRIVRPDGAVRWVQETAEVECDPGRKVVRMVGVVQDITERRLLEDQLRQSQKLESIGQLAAGVAHDFNNILTVVTGNASLLLEDLREDPGDHALVAEILKASERAANLTRQLLLFSRRQQMQPQAVDLNQLSSNLTKMLSRMLGEDVTLEFSYDTDLPMVTADPGMIELVIMNLAVNARDAMPRGGRLHLATSARMLTEEEAVLRPAARAGRYVCLAIGDTGSGIPAAIRDRIFEPFFTTKEVGKGTGLGLATVYGIVQQHRGWIELETEEGVGSTFRVWLPASPITAGEVPAEAEPALEPGRGERILFVEDEAPVRSLIRRILTRHGYEVVEAASGAEARKLPEEVVRRAELLLTDLVMPGGVNGFELAQALRVVHPGLRVIFYSGYSVELMQGRLGLREGDVFLPKPCSPGQLLSTVTGVLRRGALVEE